MYDVRMPGLSTRSLCAAAVLGVLATACRTEPGPGGPPDTAIPPLAAGVTPRAPDRFLRIGTIFTPDRVIEGRVLIEGDKISCVPAGTGCALQPGAAGA